MTNTVIKGQSYDILGTLNIDLVGAIVNMKYTSPNITTASSLLCTIENEHTINVNIPAEINNVLGTWKFWLYITYVNGDIYISKPTVIQVIEEGSI